MIFSLVSCPVFTSCYDDYALNGRIDKVEQDVTQLKSDLAALKTAVENKLTVIDYNQVEGGYELVMSDGTTINLLNGKDGTDGQQGPAGPAGPQGEKGDKGDEVVVHILSASNCTAEIVAAEQIVRVTPETGAGYVDLYAINNTTGEFKAKTISYEGYVFAVGATTYYVSPVGGDVEVPVTTLVEYEIDIDASWLAYAQTKAVREETVVLTAAE